MPPPPPWLTVSFEPGCLYGAVSLTDGTWTAHCGIYLCLRFQVLRSRVSSQGSEVLFSQSEGYNGAPHTLECHLVKKKKNGLMVGFLLLLNQSTRLACLKLAHLADNREAKSEIFTLHFKKKKSGECFKLGSLGRILTH